MMSGYTPPADQIIELYSEMFSVLYVYAKNALGDPELAADVTQDVFCIALEKRDELLQSQNPKGWLMKTLKNVIQNTKRQRIKMRKLAIISHNSNQPDLLTTYDEEDIDILYGDVAEKEDFQILKRVELDGYTIKEVADQFGISFEACKKRVQRMRKYLYKKIILQQKTVPIQDSSDTYNYRKEEG